MKVKYIGRNKVFVFGNKRYDLKHGDIIEIPDEYESKFLNNSYLKQCFEILDEKGRTKIESIVEILKDHERRIKLLEKVIKK